MDAFDDSFPHNDLTPPPETPAKISGERLHLGDEAPEFDVDVLYDRVGVDLVPRPKFPSRPTCPVVVPAEGAERDGADNERLFKPLSSDGDVLREGGEVGRLSVCDAATTVFDVGGEVEIAPEGVGDRSVTGSSSAPSTGPTTSGPRGGSSLPLISSSVRPYSSFQNRTSLELGMRTPMSRPLGSSSVESYVGFVFNATSCGVLKKSQTLIVCSDHCSHY